MFKAVRDHSKRAGAAFRDRRLQRAGRLFLFEFVVVLLGVLAAQMLQSWASRRQARDQASAAVTHLRGEAAQMLSGARFWDENAQCLRDHVRDIAIAAAQGRNMSARDIGRPALPTPEVTQWDQATLLAVRASYGEPVVQAYQDLEKDAEITIGFNSEIARDWAVFGLLDSELGELLPTDRANVRLAAMKVQTQIRMEQFKAQETVRTAGRLDVSSADRQQNRVLKDITDRCGLLKNW